MTKQLRTLVDRVGDEAAAAKAAKPLPGFKSKASMPAPRRAASGWFRKPRTVAS
jgi:hypothetical protein